MRAGVIYYSMKHNKTTSYISDISDELRSGVHIAIHPSELEDNDVDIEDLEKRFLVKKGRFGYLEFWGRRI